jgi:hypothetical protein
MIKMTKTQLTELFNSSKSYAEIGQELSTETLDISEKMVQAMFRDNGFNLRSRARKSKDSWYTVIDDVTPATQTWNSEPITETEEVESEEFA